MYVKPTVTCPDTLVPGYSFLSLLKSDLEKAQRDGLLPATPNITGHLAINSRPMLGTTLANGVYDNYTMPVNADGALMGMGGGLPWLDVGRLDEIVSFLTYQDVDLSQSFAPLLALPPMGGGKPWLVSLADPKRITRSFLLLSICRSSLAVTLARPGDCLHWSCMCCSAAVCINVPLKSATSACFRRKASRRGFKISRFHQLAPLQSFRPFTMPTVGPSILFAAGLALGVGTGVLIPRLGKSEVPPPPVFTPPPPPSGEKREVGKLATPSGGVMLAGAFPGACERHNEPHTMFLEELCLSPQVPRPTLSSA